MDRLSKSACLIALHVLTCACWVWGAQATPSAQELHHLSLDNFSPLIRNQIEEAYSYARSHPKDAAASGRLAMTLQAYGLLQEAATSYGRAAELEPDNFRWIYFLGLAQAEQGQCQQASSNLRRALRINPDYVPAKLRLANCLLISSDLEESDRLYTDIINQAPDTAEAYYGLGRVRASRHDYAGAAEAYSKAISLFPDFGAAHYALALAYRTQGETTKAEQELRLYQNTKDNAPPIGDKLLAEVRALNRSASYQVQIGIELEQAGKLQESAAAHEKALEIDHDLLQAHINLIKLYGRLGEFEKAEEHYRAAIRLDPASAESYFNYGVLLLSAQKYQSAEDAFKKTIEINPYYADAHNNLGYSLESLGRSSEAENEYREALENNPGYEQAHFNLGRLLVNQKRYQQGIQELEKTIGPEDENTPRYLYALGAAFARAGDRENALRYIRQARDGAAARGQSALQTSIERDLHALEAPGTSQ